MAFPTIYKLQEEEKIRKSPIPSIDFEKGTISEKERTWHVESVF